MYIVAKPTLRGMILAAGRGLRMRPLTFYRAKPALPFLNRPLIQYSLDLFRRARIDEIIVNLHHLPETVVEAVERDPRVHFSYEAEILGTGGAISNVREFLAGRPFVTSNGKIYLEDDLTQAIDFHHDSGALVTMILAPYPENGRLNPVLLGPDDRVIGFGSHLLETEPSEPAHRIPRRFAFTGVQIMAPEVLHLLPGGAFDTVKDFYPDLIRQGHSILGFPTNTFWCESSSPVSYLENSVRLLQHRGRDSLGDYPEGVRARASVVAPGTRIGRGTQLEQSILWQGAEVGLECSLNRVIVTGGVVIPDGTQLEDVVLTPAPPEWEEESKPDGKPPFLHWPLDLEDATP